MKAILWRLLAVFSLALIALPAQAQRHVCDIELVLALDVSGSVNWMEYRIQLEGLAQAFRSPAVIQAIEITAHRGVFATVMQWSGEPHQAQIVPWRQLTDKASIEAFAVEIESGERVFTNFSTAIGNALAEAGRLLRRNGRSCRRQVIDVSGDGSSNEGEPPEPIRDLLVAAGVNINGLVILGSEPGLKDYYRQSVIGGPGAFLMTANSFDDYPEAILKKLLRELTSPIVLLDTERVVNE